MGLTEKVKGKLKVNKDSSGKQKTSSAGGILMPLLLIALLGVCGFVAWQLIQLNNRLAGGSSGIDMTGFSSSSGDSNSYEYAVDFIFDSNLSGRMAQRGKEGWQVVGSRRTQDSITGQLGYEFIFMRKAKN